MLVKYVSSKKDMWSYYLDTCVFAYNTSRHESTKYSPFMLMFGRRATLPIDVDLERQSSEDLCDTYWQLEDPPYPVAFTEHVHILEEAKGNIIAAQFKQKEAYDKKHCKPGQFQCDQFAICIVHRCLLDLWLALILLSKMAVTVDVIETQETDLQVCLMHVFVLLY